MKKSTKKSNTNLSSYAALGCVVLITTPPASAERPYFGVRVARFADGKYEKYTPVYKCADPEQARELAAQIAKDRGIKVETRATPERPVIHPPAKRQ
jgi:hypothetical protein